VLAHIGIPAAVAVVMVAITKLIAFAIDDKQRWRRLLVLVFILMAATAAVGWWVLGDGGLQVIMHDFSPASIAQPRSGPR
jgi:hypothetical protein